MKRFLLKVSLFLIPLLGSFLFTFGFYTTDKGDLLRMGYIADIYKDYRKQFETQINQPLLFDKVSEVFLKKTKKKSKSSYDIFTIGDSFSEQKAIGFQNELAKISNFKILHYDGYLRKEDPVKELYALIKGGFFDSFQPKMILLESVERGIGWRSFDMESAPNPVFYEDLQERQRMYDGIQPLLNNPFHFDRLVKFPLTNLLYLVHDKALISEVYKVNTDKSYFSCGNNQLLFFEEDITLMRANKDSAKIQKLNYSLNIIAKELASKGIDFCVMVAPDKHTIYQNRIKGNYPESSFFNLFEKEPKNYRYIRLDKVLQQNLDKTKDLYFYDDTHWSPSGVNIVGKEIFKQIK